MTTAQDIKNRPQRMGIIQSRGLGDIVISLPIAHWWHRKGWDIYWPICSEFISHFRDTVPWVTWLPVTTDRGSFFYDQPLKALEPYNCDEIIPLYQALTGHPEFSNELYFQHTKFDQYKYIRAGVPFLEKWTLSQCITRNPEREGALYTRLIKNPRYALVHLEGSDHRAAFDPGIIPLTGQP